MYIIHCATKGNDTDHCISLPARWNNLPFLRNGSFTVVQRHRKRPCSVVERINRASCSGQVGVTESGSGKSLDVMWLVR